MGKPEEKKKPGKFDKFGKKPEEKKPEEKKPEEKQPGEKKPEEKKPEEKKPEEKKPEEDKPGVTLTVTQIHDQVVELVHANMPAAGFSKFNVQYIKPDDKKVLEFSISPRNFKRKTPEEVTELISEQVMKQMVEFGLNITQDDLVQAKLEVKKPDEKKPEEKKPEEKKPTDKKPEEKTY